jgi:hypothetical protein
MKALILIGCFSVLFVTACTQSRYIKKGYAYSQQVKSGVNQIDEKGNSITPGIEIMGFIYLESKGSIKPKIDKVIYKGILYNNPRIFSSGNSKIVIGDNKADGKPIILSPAKGNTLWRIDLTLTGKDLNNKTRAQNTIIVKGKKDGHFFSIKIDKVIELQTAIGV